MGYSLYKKKEGANKTFESCLSHFHSSSQPSISLPTPQNDHPKRFKIGEWLLFERWITSDQLAVALKEQTRRQKRLGELMLDLGFISADQLLEALSTLSGLPFISLAHQILDLSLVHQIPLDVATRHQLILFQQDASGSHLAMVDPEDLLALDKVRLLLGPQTPVIPYHATMGEVARALEIYYPQPTVDTHEGEVVRLVNDIILEAVRLNASDIHLSPTAHRIDVHYRQDGLMHLAHTLHKEREKTWSYGFWIKLNLCAHLMRSGLRHRI